jgi:hypothetical protein
MFGGFPIGGEKKTQQIKVLHLPELTLDCRAVAREKSGSPPFYDRSARIAANAR